MGTKIARMCYVRIFKFYVVGTFIVLKIILNLYMHFKYPYYFYLIYLSINVIIIFKLIKFEEVFNWIKILKPYNASNIE